MKELRERELKMGDFVIKSARSGLQYGIVVGESSIMLEAGIQSYDGVVFLVKDLTEEEKKIYNKLSSKYGDLTQPKLKHSTNHKIVRGDILEYKGEHYVYLGYCAFNDNVGEKSLGHLYVKLVSDKHVLNMLLNGKSLKCDYLVQPHYRLNKNELSIYQIFLYNNTYFLTASVSKKFVNKIGHVDIQGSSFMLKYYIPGSSDLFRIDLL
jgi:hypothetical protein